MQTQMLIGGSWSNGTEQIAVHNPATGEEIAVVAGGGPAEATAAVDAADAAQRLWAATAPRVRSEVLQLGFPVPTSKIRIDYAQLGGQAGFIGAAGCAAAEFGAEALARKRNFVG